MIPALALVGSIAALVSLAAPLVLIPLLVRLGAHDDATDRSSHSGRALRGLGLGVLAAFLAAMGVGLVQIPTSEIGITAIVTLAAAAVALIGLAEDVRGVGALGRFAAQSAVGALVGGSLVVVAGMPAWAVPLVALWFTAYVNFTNFMDGVDGISSSHGIVVGAAFTIAGALWLEPWLSFVGVAIAASFGGFLPWNLRRRGTFLGDTGSYLLGGSVAAATAVATLRDVPVVVVVAPLAIYLTDTVVTVIRRMAAAEPWLAPHRSHAYQRLTQRGLSHIAASTVVSAVSALCAVAGLIAGTLGPAWQWAGWVAIAGVAAAYLASPVLLGAPVPAATIREPPPSPLPAGAGIPERGRAIVVGASGFVGSHVARRLRDDGWEATAVAPPRLSLSPGSTSDDVRRAVLAHESAVIDLSQALGEVDVVVNAAGIAAPDSRRGASLTGANALLPAIIVAAAQRAGSRRFVHVSS
ncbi:NAD-dependent epimerase/dehydratase family protein, partial [Yonghaparkia sp. Soil809]|uniref:NAD-dependent epimerase/dehydratase family protein n=1 Tax=Yonghaparkia sp. Soil809 TaxID=1736417 RepID=UPI001F47ECD2